MKLRCLVAYTGGDTLSSHAARGDRGQHRDNLAHMHLEDDW